MRWRDQVASDVFILKSLSRPSMAAASPSSSSSSPPPSHLLPQPTTLSGGGGGSGGIRRRKHRELHQIPTTIYSVQPPQIAAVAGLWCRDAESFLSMDSGGAFPSNYNNRFNYALNAGLLNPMSPPLDKTRSSPTLFDMMSNEQEYQQQTTTVSSTSTAAALPPPQDRQLLLQERVMDLIASASPGSHFNDVESGDVKLTLSSKDGLVVSMNVHRQILVAHSRFFASKLSDRWSRQQRSFPHLVEISDCDDVGIYVETLRLMYCRDLRRRLMKEDVCKVLGILKVAAAISFDAGVLACLEFLEAAPWAEEEEEKVASLLAELRLESSGAAEVLRRVSGGDDAGGENFSGEEVVIRLLQVVLEGRDEKARREMKGLVSKMLRENDGGDLISKDSLYSACEICLRQLRHHFFLAASTSATVEEVAQIARHADNLQWLVDILVDRQMAEEFLGSWAAQEDLASAHGKVPAIHRHEISRVTSRFFVGIGKGELLVSKESRILLLRTWLEPFYEDFGWMRRAWKGVDRHSIEEGLANTILTLPMGLQQELLLAWFDRFLNSGDDCPNIQRGFEVWWRRAFWRRNAGDQDNHQPPTITTTKVLQVATPSENPSHSS